MSMEEQTPKRLRETAWRRPLTSDETAALQRFLESHPAEGVDWETELALSRALDQLPQVAVSSNFTARVLLAAQTVPARPGWRAWFALTDWLPEGRAARLAFATGMVCLGVFSFHETTALHRTHMARQLAGVSRVANLPRVEWLKDFDTINRISQVKVADDDLLVALE